MLKMDSFSAWWQLSITWLEPPNEERGGWSGVGRWMMPGEPSEHRLLYVKRQQNHTRFSLWSPWHGTPTFAVEYQMLRYLQKKNILVPHVAYAGVRDSAEGRQAILVTQALVGFIDLEQWMKDHTLASAPELIAAVARAIRQLHAAGIQHRALYPKHLFVRATDEGYEIAFIDLEKAQPMWLPVWQRWRDIRQLMSRLKGYPDSVSVQLFDAYAKSDAQCYRRLAWWWIRATL